MSSIGSGLRGINGQGKFIDSYKNVIPN